MKTATKPNWNKAEELLSQQKIPDYALNDFLDTRLKIQDIKNISKVTNTFLWEANGLERYRVNVWMSEEVRGHFYNRNYIGYSWFVYYDVKEDVVIDKTIHPKNEE